MDEPQPRYWFPAKRYGWGWGPPCAWQGWLVLAIFFVLVALGAMWLLPLGREGAFVVYVAALCLLLVVVCWVKGEPPRFRRGRR